MTTDPTQATATALRTDGEIEDRLQDLLHQSRSRPPISDTNSEIARLAEESPLGTTGAQHLRRRGRPPIPGLITVRLGGILPRLDAYAAHFGITRAQAIREILDDSLAVLGYRTKTPDSNKEQPQ